MRCNKIVAITLILLLALTAMVGCSPSEPASTPAPEPAEEPSGEAPAEAPAEAPESGEFVPSRHITGIAWASAGGGADRSVRAIQRAADLNPDIMDATIAAITRPGGGGAEGMRYLLDQPADGHNFLAVTPSGVFTTLTTDLGWDFTAFLAIMQMGVEPLHMTIRANDDRFSNIEEFVEYAKANPGELSVGTFGAGSQMDVAFLLFAQGVGIDVNAIPFEGTGPRIAALLGGHIDGSINNASDDFEIMRAGEVISIVHFSDEQMDSIPDTPSIPDTFGFSVGIDQWRGYVLHGDTPDYIVDWYEDKFTQLYHTDEYQEYLAGEGVQPMYRNSDEFTAFLRNQHEVIDAIYQEYGLGIYSN